MRVGKSLCAQLINYPERFVIVILINAMAAFGDKGRTRAANRRHHVSYNAAYD